MRQGRRSEDVASESFIARGDDANGPSDVTKFMRKFVSKKMVAIHSHQTIQMHLVKVDLHSYVHLLPDN